MDDLTYGLRLLCRRYRDGTHVAQANRLRALTLASRQLREAGFRQMRITSLKGRHVRALLQRWRTEGLSARTIETRIRHLRWWAEQIDKGDLIPSLVPGAVKHARVADSCPPREPGLR